MPLINSERGSRLTDQIKALRRQLASDMGFIMPAIRIQDNLQLPPNTYVLRIKEIEAGRGEVRPQMLLCMDPRGEPIALPGEQTHEPTFGLPAMWIEATNREEATFRGLTVVDPQTVITTHLTEVVKDNLPELLSYSETQKLLDELDRAHQKLVADVIPSQITVTGLQRVLQNLLHERISIRDLPTILEGIAEACGYTRNITSITEHVRSRLARQISDANMGEGGYIPLVTLSPQWEQAFAESIVSHGEERQLSMAPSRLQEFIVAVRQAFERLASDRRDAGAADQPDDPPLCAFDRRAVPRRHGGDVAERGLSESPHQDAGADLSHEQHLAPDRVDPISVGTPQLSLSPPMGRRGRFHCRGAACALGR